MTLTLEQIRAAIDEVRDNWSSAPGAGFAALALEDAYKRIVESAEGAEPDKAIHDFAMLAIGKLALYAGQEHAQELAKEYRKLRSTLSRPSKQHTNAPARQVMTEDELVAKLASGIDCWMEIEPEDRGDILAAVQSLLAHQQAEKTAPHAPAVPDGFVIVPEYPTQAMRDSGNKTLNMLKTEPGMGLADRAYYCYLAMISAAPSSTAQTGGETK